MPQNQITIRLPLAESVLNLGNNYFNKAPDYNDGQFRKNYGQVLARPRNETFLATKLDERISD